jgi:alanine racemase
MQKKKLKMRNFSAKQIGYRPTWVEVDLGALEYNFNQVKQRLAAQTKVLVCVKSDAYGHGIVPVSQKLVFLGVDYLGVASIDEGIVLRKAGMRIPILVLGMVLTCDIQPIFKYNLTQTVCSEELAVALNKMAKDAKKRVNIHVKIDTGMGRLGVLYKDAFSFIKKIKRLAFLNLEGLYTHFPCADINSSFTGEQIKIFDRLIARLRADDINIPLCHAANSMGVLAYRKSHFNLVRPGLIIYGLYPRRNINLKLKPVMSLKTKVIYLKRMPAGWGISYGHTYRTRRNTTVVTLPIGYGDGYPRNLSDKAEVLIRKNRFRISGRICMDQILVDVAEVPVKIGDEVILIGSDGVNKITAEELAHQAGTIPYEIVCGIGSRVPRIYKE